MGPFWGRGGVFLWFAFIFSVFPSALPLTLCLCLCAASGSFGEDLDSALLGPWAYSRHSHKASEGRGWVSNSC